MEKECDFNPNKPVGATKKLIKPDPIMEQFNKHWKQGLHCSIGPGAEAVPYGAREYFNNHGYMIISNLYDPKELYSPVINMRGQMNWWGKNEDHFNYNQKEPQVPGSLSRYFYPQYREAHSKIRLILEDILGEKLYNTYYYDRFYFKGQRLVRHSDRDACEVSVSIQISTNSNKPWAFCIETPNGEEHSLELQNGWGILYKGCEREHWREPLESRHSKVKQLIHKVLRKEDDTYHHQIFFHYVRANGPRSHFANDYIR